MDDTEDEGRRIETAVKDAEETPELAALARRPEIAAAFARYRAEGGLLPRLRFAEGHALMAGFANRRAPSLAALTLLEDLTPGREMSEGERTELRARPFAFDLACAIPIGRTGFVVQDFDVWGHEIGGAMPVPGTTIRISADGPAGLWRGARSFVSEATHGDGGTLVVPARAEPGQEASGRLVIDGRAGTIDDTRRVADPATGRVRVDALWSTCARLPFSRLFGVGEAARSRGE